MENHAYFLFALIVLEYKQFSRAEEYGKAEEQGVIGHGFCE